MNPLAQFQWYRRMRGGYWGKRPGGWWVRVTHYGQAPPNSTQWTFYPWATRTMGNGYVDEWFAVGVVDMVPLSEWMNANCCDTCLAKVKAEETNAAKYLR